MKRIHAVFLASALTGAMVVPQVFGAMTVKLDQDASQYSYGVGGEFRAVGNADLNSVINWSAYSSSTAVQDNYFQTFCTEQLETFSPGTTYTVSSIGDSALYNGGGPPGVPITLGVAYLYSQFASGGLVTYGYDYTYGSGRVASAGNLQQAIWYLLGETGDGATLTGTALNALNAVTGNNLGDVFASSADWKQAANGAFGVMDMVVGNAGQHQDQLIIAVPEATTMFAALLLLLPLGASTLRIMRKNRMA